ncbi:hypothetical protein [Spiroplasma floricola]|uniref:Transmembrane protein n=1 Tax=Spiroplasma floricola 23-6 TaxID=1336749 RepID=A0A2K8SGW0_9MOLU|nr:hypothetical protein [Spiroplasma floricola]AUB32060.1 hypothetical protein SFLOR_v1c10140 [Spiroplasma floricola 23-6]
MKHSINKKIAKNVYILFVIMHLSILFISISYAKGNYKFYQVIQIASIINTIIITALCLWIIIESSIIISHLKRTFYEIKTFKFLARGNFLSDFFKLIIISVPIFISTEAQAFDYIWKDNQKIINLEILLIFSLVSIIFFSIIIISLNLIFNRLRKVVKLNISEKIFFAVFKNFIEEENDTKFVNMPYLIFSKIKIKFKEVFEKNLFIQQIINSKKSLSLRIFKRGVTPPNSLFNLKK